MQTFFVALLAVGVLLAIAAPGYILKKKEMIGENCIPGFSKLMLYVCQPCLCIYTFRHTEFSVEKLTNIGVFSLLVLLIHAIMLGGAFLIFRKKSEEPIYRIMTVACAFGNCAFFGIPLIEALFPEIAPELLIYTSVYAVLMNLLGWTVGSAIISHSTKHISARKIFLNPAFIGLVLAVPFFIFDIPLPAAVGDMIDLTGRMCTPLSMLIMGMRLATVDLGAMVKNVKIYLTVAVKQIVMPFIGFLLLLVLPVSYELKITFYLILACPVASIVLNFAEILGAGQKEAASTVLFATILSILTIPVMVLLLPLI